MYINNLSYKEKHDCNICKHINICKFVSDMKTKQGEISKIKSSDVLSPIKIEITCGNFEKINTSGSLYR